MIIVHCGYWQTTHRGVNAYDWISKTDFRKFLSKKMSNSNSNYYYWYHQGTNILPEKDPNYIRIIATYFNQWIYDYFLSLKNTLVKISRYFCRQRDYWFTSVHVYLQNIFLKTNTFCISIIFCIPMTLVISLRDLKILSLWLSSDINLLVLL